MMLRSKKVLKPSERGLTFSFDGGSIPKFSVGEKYKYVVLPRQRKIIIKPVSDSDGLTISRKKVSAKVKSLIDLRSNLIRGLISDCDQMVVYIYDNKIVVKIIKSKTEEFVEINRKLIEKVSDIILFGNYGINEVLKTISTFSSCGLLDYSFEKEGFDIMLALDVSKSSIKTYNKNHKPVAIVESIYNYDYRDNHLPKANVFIGGPSCRPFSKARSNRSIEAKAHEDYGLVEAFFDWALDKKTNRYDVICMENVPGFQSDNKYLKRVEARLKDSGYEVDYGILDEQFLGGAQRRKRFFLIASLIGKIVVDTGHRIKPKTVGQVLDMLTNHGQIIMTE